MTAFDPAKFAPSALDERFDAEMVGGHEAMRKTRCTVSEIEIALGGGALDQLDAAAFADPCQRYPLPQGPLSKCMIRARLQLLLFRDGTSRLHEHMEEVFGIAPIEDRDAEPGWVEEDCPEAHDLGPADDEARRAQGLTERLWKIARVHEAFVREMLEGDLGWALILGFRKFGDRTIADTSETVAGVVRDLAPLWLFAGLHMGANACRLRRNKPPQMPVWAKAARGIPRLFRAIKALEQRIAKFEKIQKIYNRDLRRPVSDFSLDAPLHLSWSDWLATSSMATFAVTLQQYGKDASAREVAAFEADGTADEARAQLLIWRKEHGDQLESYVEFRMKEAEVKLEAMRKRLDRLRSVRGFPNLDLANYNQARQRARLVLACEQAAAWLPPPLLPSEGRPTKGHLKLVETEYQEAPSPIGDAINAIAVAVLEFGPNALALAKAKICVPQPSSRYAKRTRDLNYLFANLVVEGMSQDVLLEKWDEGTKSGDNDNADQARRTDPERAIASIKNQFEHQTQRARHHEVQKEARGALDWRFRNAGVACSSSK